MEKMQFIWKTRINMIEFRMELLDIFKYIKVRIMRLYFLFFLVMLISCNEKQFASNELGFKIEVPNGYKILNSCVDESENNLLNNINDKGLDVKQLENLICFQKDKFNLLTSTTRAYDNYNLEEWEIDIDLNKKMAFEMYRENGIKMDTTKTIVEKIGGYDFKKYTFVIYDYNNEIWQLLGLVT